MKEVTYVRAVFKVADNVPSIGVGFLKDFKTKLYYENRT